MSVMLLRSFFSSMTRSRLLFVGTLGIAAACASIPFPNQADQRRPEWWAFTAPWDPRSDSSARANASRLDAIVYGWIPLDSISGQPFDLYADTLSRRAPASVMRMALVTSWHNDRFHPETIRRLAGDPRALATAASAVAARASAHEYRGLVLDFEGMSAPDVAATHRVVAVIADSARAHGVRRVALAIPALDTAGYPAQIFIPAVDQVVVMLYDEHWSGSPPGPIASPDWARQALARRVAEVGASHVVAALPLYGYLWPAGRPAQTIGFAQAQRLALEGGTTLSRDNASTSLTASRVGEWQLWIADAKLVERLSADAQSLGVRSIALWRLGLEDPSIWNSR
jgi:peptidoglycan-N-acetylglucosamine deacetylase